MSEVLNAKGFEDDEEMSEAKEVVRPELWVDKYAPKKFFDLITDELQNRNVLTWLKSWD